MSNAPAIRGAGVLGKEARDATHNLDTFDLPATMTEVTYTSDEFTSVCPVTGQPDWYVVKIQLVGSRIGIESKSLKLYLQSYRNEGAFCEALADEIATDVSLATDAPSVWVTLFQKSRGGITITAEASISKSPIPPPGTVPPIPNAIFNLERGNDGQSTTEQDVPVRGGTPPPEPQREVP